MANSDSCPPGLNVERFKLVAEIGKKVAARMKEFFTPEEDKRCIQTPEAIPDGLPKVLLVGDSISCGYTEPVGELLRNVCEVGRAPDNCGDTRRGLEKLDEWRLEVA